MTPHISINEPSHLQAFIALNEQWILQYFSLEYADHELAANPEQITENGGYIFSATLQPTPYPAPHQAIGSQVVGVCALFYQGEGVYELGRMAVAPAHQGHRIGEKLMLASLDQLKLVSARRVFLASNTKLEAAIKLYKKYGFSTVSEGAHVQYNRANIVMEKQLP
jgi:ribosomal protein S18 acetylase RimI-like enzyme